MKRLTTFIVRTIAVKMYCTFPVSVFSASISLVLAAVAAVVVVVSAGFLIELLRWRAPLVLLVDPVLHILYKMLIF